MAITYTSKKVKRNILLVAVALIVMVVIWLLPGRGESKLVNFPAIQDKVHRIVFARQDQEFTLEWQDGQWVVGDKKYPANKDKAEKIAAFIAEERVAELVSSVDVYQPYGLDQEEALKITFYGEDDLLNVLRVGKSANRFGTFYGMIGDDPAVYQIIFDRYHLDQQEKDMYDLNIFGFSPPTIVKASLDDQDGDSWELTRVEKKIDSTNNQNTTEKNWEDSSGKVFPKEQVNDIINTMSTLIGDSLHDELDGSSLNSPLRKINLTSKDNKTYALDIIEKTENGYWVRASETEYYYLISTVLGDKLLMKFTF